MRRPSKQICRTCKPNMPTMNRLYIVTYDLVSPGQNYESLINKINSFSDWARLGGSAYLIFTNKSHTEIRDEFLECLGPNDKIYVGLLGNSAAWRSLGDVVGKWIIERQK
jgi:hypothetical protein